MADEAAVRRVHDNGHVPWLTLVAGFLVPPALDPGPLSADSGQSLRLNQSWAEVEAAEPFGGSVW